MTQKDWVMNVWCSVTLVLQQIMTSLSGVRSISPHKQFCNMIAYPASNCLPMAAVGPSQLGSTKYLIVRSSKILFSVLFTFLTMSQRKWHCIQYHLSQGPQTHNRRLYRWRTALRQVQRDTSVLWDKNCCMVTNRQMKSVGFHVSSRGAHCGKMKQKKKRANLPKVLLVWRGNQYAPLLFMHPADLIKLCFCLWICLQRSRGIMCVSACCVSQF